MITSRVDLRTLKPFRQENYQKIRPSSSSDLDLFRDLQSWIAYCDYLDQASSGNDFKETSTKETLQFLMLQWSIGENSDSGYWIRTQG
jgi:hypothetical protein